MKAFLRETLTTLLLAVVIFFGTRVTLQHTVVVSASMEPTLAVGQHLVIEKISYRFSQPKRGEIIVFHPAKASSTGGTPLIKRIIGLPGESVEIEEGKVIIRQPDGKVLTLDEPYVKDPATYPYTKNKIPENQYFVLGDNRNNSGDSREGWTVPRSNIIGKAWVTIWPLSKWGMVTNHLQAK